MIKTSDNLKTLDFLSVIILILVVIGMAHCVGWMIDNKSFPGCVVIGHERGNILVIKLNEDLATGTDMSCKLAGELIYSICLKGYKVRVTNWTIHDVINLERAYWLARGY